MYIVCNVLGMAKVLAKRVASNRAVQSHSFIDLFVGTYFVLPPSIARKTFRTAMESSHFGTPGVEATRVSHMKVKTPRRATGNSSSTTAENLKKFSCSGENVIVGHSNVFKVLQCTIIGDCDHQIPTLKEETLRVSVV